ncbi:MAG: hypothetical protein M9916_00945 [Crocinitomicaceae bacterium]|nr:hypothetical protein [Crocinitomicaceae bacterium]
MKIGELKRVCLAEFAKKLNRNGEASFKNKDTGLDIIIKRTGAKHAIYARPSGFEKIIALVSIDKIIKTAVFDSVEDSKKPDFKFFIRLKCPIEIDSKKASIVVVVGVQKEKGKLNYYYDHVYLTK